MPHRPATIALSIVDPVTADIEAEVPVGGPIGPRPMYLVPMRFAELSRLLATGLVVAAAACGPGVLPIETGPEDRNPSWGPDGQWIAFEHSDSADPGSVYVARVDGAGRRRVLAGAFGPDWSPDGGSLVVNIGEALVLVDLGSGAVQPLPGAAGYGPAWSPDGATIAFSSHGGYFSAPPVLWTVPAAGGSAARVPLPGGPRTELREPDWSPAGTHLVATEAGAPYRLFITSLAGQDTAVIGVPDAGASQPAWSPRGDRIAYVRARAGQAGDIWLVRPDGSGQRLLILSAFHPSWSPDGSRIAFSRRDGGEVSVWSVDTLGQDLRRISPPD